MTAPNVFEMQLYNYMPIKYFQSLLAKGLYFKQASRFLDTKEGDFPKELTDRKVNPVLQKFESHKIQIDSEQFRSLSHASVESKGLKFINCWHLNTKFNKKMWDKYAKNGLYVMTSPHRIYNALHPATMRLFVQSAKYMILHKVIYTDTPETDIPPKLIDEAIYLEDYSHLLKRKEFECENEFRIITDQEKVYMCTGTRINSCGNTSDPLEEELRIPPEEIDFEKLPNGSVSGIYIKVNPIKLINRIGTIGSDNFETIKDILHRHELRDEIKIVNEDSV